MNAQALTDAINHLTEVAVNLRDAGDLVAATYVEGALVALMRLALHREKEAKNEPQK